MSSLAKTLGKTLAKTLGFLLLFGASASATTSTLTNSSFAGAADETPRTLTYTGRDISGDPVGSGKTVTFSVDTTALLDAAECTVSTSPGTIADDGAASATIITVLIDTDGDFVPGWAAAANVLAASGTGNDLTQPASVSNASGVQTGSITSTVAATKVLSSTLGGLLVTDTANLVVSGTPAVGRSNEPVGFTPIAEWNNETAINAEGFLLDGVTTYGEKTRVTSGYGAAPNIGGAAVVQTFYAGGVAGGYDPQRFEYHGLDVGETELYISVEAKWASDYPVSNSPGGGKQFILWFVGGARYVMNFDLSLAGGYWTIFPNSDVDVDIPTTGYHVLGAFTETEWYFNRGTGAADGIIRAYQGGTMILEATGLSFPGGAADFDYFVVDHANNGNRYATGTAPEARTISTVYPGEVRDAYVWTAAVYLSRP